MTDKFTIYDVFAVLVPGVVFLFLLTVTLKYVSGIQVFNWSGTFGDATVLVIAGYAMGSLLQAMGNLTVEHISILLRGGPMTSVMLLKKSRAVTDAFKKDVIKAINKHFGDLPSQDSAEYQKALDEKVYRAYKKISASDTIVHRFVAEHHAMRAYSVCFITLLLLTVTVGYYFKSIHDIGVTVLAITYLILSVITLWRMEHFSKTLGRHILIKFLESEEVENG